MGFARTFKRKAFKLFMEDVRSRNRKKLKIQKFNRLKSQMALAVGGVLSALILSMSFTLSPIYAVCPYIEIAKGNVKR